MHIFIHNITDLSIYCCNLFNKCNYFQKQYWWSITTLLYLVTQKYIFVHNNIITKLLKLDTQSQKAVLSRGRSPSPLRTRTNSKSVKFIEISTSLWSARCLFHWWTEYNSHNFDRFHEIFWSVTFRMSGLALCWSVGLFINF